MNKFDRNNLMAIRTAMNAAMLKVTEQFGITADMGRISFNDTEFSVKLTCNIKGAPTRADNNLAAMVKMFDLKMVGKKGEQLTGYNTKAKEYPFQYTLNGSRYKCSHDQAKDIFS